MAASAINNVTNHPAPYNTEEMIPVRRGRAFLSEAMKNNPDFVKKVFREFGEDLQNAGAGHQAQKFALQVVMKGLVKPQAYPAVDRDYVSNAQMDSDRNDVICFFVHLANAQAPDKPKLYRIHRFLNLISKKGIIWSPEDIEERRCALDAINYQLNNPHIPSPKNVPQTVSVEGNVTQTASLEPAVQVPLLDPKKTVTFAPSPKFIDAPVVVPPQSPKTNPSAEAGANPQVVTPVVTPQPQVQVVAPVVTPQPQVQSAESPSTNTQSTPPAARASRPASRGCFQSFTAALSSFWNGVKKVWKRIFG